MVHETDTIYSRIQKSVSRSVERSSGIRSRIEEEVVCEGAPHLSKMLALWEGLVFGATRISRKVRSAIGVGGTAAGPRISQGSGLHSSAFFHDSFLRFIPTFRLGPPRSFLLRVSSTSSRLSRSQKQRRTEASSIDIRYVRSGNAPLVERDVRCVTGLRIRHSM